MAAMCKLFFCVFVFCCYTVTKGQLVEDCCLRNSDKEIPKHIVRTYQHQVRGQGCSIDAVVFVTKKDRALCAEPNLPWVIKLMHHVDDLTVTCQRSNFQGKRCKGLRPKSK